MQSGRSRVSLEERVNRYDDDMYDDGHDGQFRYGDHSGRVFYSWHEYFKKGKSRESALYRPSKSRWKK